MKSLMFASLAVVAVLLGSAGAAQAQHYEQRRPSYGQGHGGYSDSRYGHQSDRHYQPSYSYRPSYGHGHVGHHAPVYAPPVYVHRPHYPVYYSQPVCPPVNRYDGYRSSDW